MNDGLELPQELRDQLNRLILSIPRPRYSDTIRAMLLEHGLVTEPEVSELKGEEIGTTKAYRARGKMPPHYKWGGLICYRRDDIAATILAQPIENAAHKRRKAVSGSILT